MSLQVLLVTNTAINLEKPGNALQPAVGGMTGQGGQSVGWGGGAFAAVTCPVASPGVWSGLYLPAGTQVQLNVGTGGSVPTGFTAGNTYFVVNPSQANQTVQLSATSGGGAINATVSAAVGATLTGLTPTYTNDSNNDSDFPYSDDVNVVVCNGTNASLVLQQSDDNVNWRTMVTVPGMSCVETTIGAQYIRVSTAATLALLAN